MKTLASFTIRPAQPDDCDLLVTLIRELAAFENHEDHARATADDLKRYLFGPRPFAEALIAEVDQAPVGFGLFFHTFSTFRGQPGLYLEDLYIRPEFRGQGIGKGLLIRLAGLARDRGCSRLEWSVLNWNASAIGFYESIGARPTSEWTVYRLLDDALLQLAATETIE